jgi:hypothetical protein
LVFIDREARVRDEVRIDVPDIIVVNLADVGEGVRTASAHPPEQESIHESLDDR